MTHTPLGRFLPRSIRCIATLGALTAVLLLPLAASAAPIELKLAFFASTRTDTFRYGVKPFVDAANAEGQGLVTVKVYPNGALGKAVAEQPGMVLDGVADIAWVVPGQTPYRFPDNQALELPGLFRNLREGTLTYTRLIAANALRGYEDFIVIGAFTSAIQVINSRKPTASLAAIKGQKIRANNAAEAEALQRFGAIPTVMPASRLADALRHGAIDAIVMTPGGLFQFGITSAVPHHYFLGMGAAPLVMLMNRKKFESLPPATQALIRKHSGERAADIWIKSFGAVEKRAREKIKSDAAHREIEPSPADSATAQTVYKSVMAAWAAKSPRDRDLLKTIQSDLAAIRSTAK